MSADNPTYDKLHQQIASVLAHLNFNQAEMPVPADQDRHDAKLILDAIWPEIEGLQQDVETSRERSKHLKELLKRVDIAAKAKWNCGNCGKECDGYCHECANRSLKDD